MRAGITIRTTTNRHRTQSKSTRIARCRRHATLLVSALQLQVQIQKQSRELGSQSSFAVPLHVMNRLCRGHACRSASAGRANVGQSTSGNDNELSRRPKRLTDCACASGGWERRKAAACVLLRQSLMCKNRRCVQMKDVVTGKAHEAKEQVKGGTSLCVPRPSLAACFRCSSKRLCLCM